MKKDEIVVGGFYLAKVSGRVVTVRVDAIEKVEGYRPSNPEYGQRKKPDKTRYACTNMATGKKISIRSAAKFRSRAADPAKLAKTSSPGDSHEVGGVV